VLVTPRTIVATVSSIGLGLSLALSVAGCWRVEWTARDMCTICLLVPGGMVIGGREMPIWPGEKPGVHIWGYSPRGLLLFPYYREAVFTGTPPNSTVQALTNHAEVWELGVPLWPVAAVLGALVWYLLLSPSALRASRKRQGLCVKCGYDLRGQTEPRCPECNTPFDRLGLRVTSNQTTGTDRKPDGGSQGG
jgi:hypothetical protein